MSTAKHTPGPWEAIKWTSHAPTTVVSAEWAAAILKGKHFTGGAVIADCQGARSGYLDDEAEANARLIAAAPELLEALTKIRQVADGFKVDVPWGKIIEMADAALRKARGEQ